MWTTRIPKHATCLLGTPPPPPFNIYFNMQQHILVDSECDWSLQTQMWMCDTRIHYLNTSNILWCNCTPIPDDMPQGQTNSHSGPNSKEQRVINESVINRNASIAKEMAELNVELLDIYEKIKPIAMSIQRRKHDLHFSPQGELYIAQLICKRLKELFF